MSNKKESTHQLIHRNLTLYQREHSAVWQCRYKVDNKWIRATTKETQFELAVNKAKELIEYLEKHSLAILCDAELYDSDSCELRLPIYNMTFYLRHQYEYARLNVLVWAKEGSEFKSLAELDERLKSFNNNHATKLSYHFDLVKKWFSKNRYKPTCYFLSLEAPPLLKNRGV
jgi:hypothetical protein